MNRTQHTVGIDIASQSFCAAIFHIETIAVVATEEFANSEQGIAQFLAWMSKHTLQKHDTQICVEATGVYTELLCHCLFLANWHIAVEPPKNVKRAFGKQQKNDRVDAQQIAEYAWRYADKLTAWQPKAQTIEHLRALLSARELLVEHSTATKNNRTALRRKVTVCAVTLKTLDQMIDTYDKQIKKLNKQIEALLRKDQHINGHAQRLLKIPGVGILLIANIAVVTNGFTTSTTASSLGCFLGLCPHEWTSGTSVRKRSRSRGYGPSRLRKLLHLAARSQIGHDPVAQIYHARKIAEGKHPSIVRNNLANKLLRTIMAMVANQTEYNPSFSTSSSS